MDYKKKQKTGVKNKKGCQIEKGKKNYPHQKRASNRKKKTPSRKKKADNSQMPTRLSSFFV